MLTQVSPSDFDFLTVYDIDRGSGIRFDAEYARLAACINDETARMEQARRDAIRVAEESKAVAEVQPTLQGISVLLVEQNANFALGVSQRGYVLETGKVALTNESSKLREDPEVQRAYLGT